MVATYAMYNRLTPEDEGVLIKTGTVVTRKRRGIWPVIMPSETNPLDAYEIEPDGDELRCSCPAYDSAMGSPKIAARHSRQASQEGPLKNGANSYGSEMASRIVIGGRSATGRRSAGRLSCPFMVVNESKQKKPSISALCGYLGLFSTRSPPHS